MIRQTQSKTAFAKRLFAGVALAATALAPAGPGMGGTGGMARAQSVTAPAGEIVLSIGRGQLVNVAGQMTDIFIANDAIADVKVKSRNQLYVFGKAGGETTVYASNAAYDIVWSANVRVGSNIDSIDQMLGLAMPEARIATATMNNMVLLTGTVASPGDAAEAERLVAAFVGDGVNVISRLKTATPLQVSLHVRFAEVSRSLVREMASNLVTRDTTGGFQFGVQRGSNNAGCEIVDAFSFDRFPRVDASAMYNLPEGSISLPFDPTTGQFVVNGTRFSSPGNQSEQTALNLAGKLLGIDVNLGLDLAERVGLITTLSQPNLTALSGETATFLAGGEYPIPISQGLGATSVQYREYGVSLSYSPTVLANGRISLRVRPEVSELSSQGAITIEGFQIPALTTRRAETTVELGSGQSFMIAGLLSNNSRQTLEKTPGAGDLPIIGSLFRSTDFRRGETELVIVVTPYLVEPVDAKDIVLPTDGYRAPDELQRILGNMQTDGVSAGVTGSERPMPRSEPAPALRADGGAVAPPAGPYATETGDPAPGFSF
ncbi:type II and III secretion system protein family protein [Croceicoccus sp. YJ47]|uniref:type II and III secretion system protein family protein n=1 Tax=Croceicoccus sp. YJ47 TaxID=2798724 RepID=UPI001920F303|nr:type II and III secretion system protein family protein [Croceicoccus sp. YJ47]